MSDPGMTRPVGWNWIISMSRSVSPARHASAMPSEALSAEHAKIRYIVGPPPIASRVARARSTRNAGALVEHEGAGAASVRIERQLHRAAFLERPHVRSHGNLLAQAIHDLDAGEIALVNCAVVGLAGERLLVDVAVGPPIEEAAVARLELEDAGGRFGDQRPHQLLIVDEAAALERVEQVRLERIGRSEHGVVASLDHPRAAGAAEQALDDDPDAQAWRRVGGVQGSAEAGAAGAQDQEIEVELIHGSGTDVDVALFLQFHHADDAPLWERLGPRRQLLERDAERLHRVAAGFETDALALELVEGALDVG